MRFLQSGRARAAFLICVFLLMLLANFLTPKVVDDWTYGFSFATGAPISSLSDAAASIRVHSQFINGRAFAHFLVHIFEALPKPVFNLINAGVFTLILFLLYRLCRERDSSLLLFVLFAGLWIFSPGFGQVFLWLDGSVNYGWGAALALGWLYPYVKQYSTDDLSFPGLFWAVWALGGFLCGAYVENISVASIFLAAALLIALAAEHRKVPMGAVIGVLAAVAGLLFMVTRPAESLKGSGLGSPAQLGTQVVAAFHAYRMLEIPVFFFAGAFTLCCFRKQDRKRLILSALFFLGSLCAGGVLCLASYIPERVLIFPAVLLLTADGILFAELQRAFPAELTACAAALLTVSLLFNGVTGMADVTKTGMAVRANERMILDARDRGEREVSVPMVSVYTRYSPLWGLKYLDMEDPASWPNHDMARALGVDAILGFEEGE